MLSGLTFRMGFVLVFMAMLNYLSDASLTYAASAQGIASTCRSIFGTSNVHNYRSSLGLQRTGLPRPGNGFHTSNAAIEFELIARRNEIKNKTGKLQGLQHAEKRCVATLKL